MFERDWSQCSSLLRLKHGPTGRFAPDLRWLEDRHFVGVHKPGGWELKGLPLISSLCLGLLVSIIKDLKGQVSEVLWRDLWTCVYFSKFLAYVGANWGIKGVCKRKGSLWEAVA